MAKIFITADIPDDLHQTWLQHVRDFDTANPGCHFEVAVEAPEVALFEAIAELQVNPALNFTQIYKRRA